jgi:hypothetical protein
MVSINVPSRSHKSTLGMAKVDAVRVLLGGKIRLVWREVAIESMAKTLSSNVRASQEPIVTTCND